MQNPKTDSSPTGPKTSSAAVGPGTQGQQPCVPWDRSHEPSALILCGIHNPERGEGGKQRTLNPDVYKSTMQTKKEKAKVVFEYIKQKQQEGGEGEKRRDQRTLH